MCIQFVAILLISLALIGGALLYSRTASAATSRGIDYFTGRWLPFFNAVALGDGSIGTWVDELHVYCVPAST